MTDEDMTAEEAVRTLRAASPQQDLDLISPVSLAEAVALLPTAAAPDIVDRLGEALLLHEMESLLWTPIEAAGLILVLIRRGSPSRRLLKLSMNYVSMYFQELDVAIQECRLAMGAGESESNVGASLSRALGEVTEVLDDGYLT